MPVHGKILRINPHATVGGMPIESCGYIFAKEFQLSKSKVVIPLGLDVYFNLEDLKESFLYDIGVSYVAIYRIGNNHSDESYIVDFYDNDSVDEYPLFVDKDSELDMDILDYLILNIDESYFEYEDVDGIDNYPNPEIKKAKVTLISLLREAERNENYEKAAQIRDEILKTKKKQTKGR